VAQPAWKSETEQTRDPGAELSLIYHDSRERLAERVWRVRSGKSPASLPPIRTMHMIGNVQFAAPAEEGLLQLRSNWTAYHYDPKRRTQHVLFGFYEHDLRPEGAGWTIACKKIVLLDDPTGLGINRAGFVIHGALHAARADVACVLHTHSAAGIAVSAQAEGLLPLSQHAAVVLGTTGYHDFEGIAIDADEQARLVRDPGANRILILRNHGLLTAGRTAAEAIVLMLTLERACAAQLAALAGGR
jgi:3-phenylpropionate/cinnamic acid dioxygenase small subunit